MTNETNYQDFEQMEVWQDGQDLAVSVYTDFAKVKDFSFCDQIKRAAVKNIKTRGALRF
jgi:hypothetical protein